MTERITSVHNPRVRRAIQLRDRDARAEQQRFLIDGSREIQRALEAGIEIDELFVCEPSLRSSGQSALQLALSRGIHPIHVAPAVQARLAYGDRDEGLVACARTPRHSLADLQLAGEPLVAVLAGLEKPGNIGAVLRSADAAGVSAVIVAGGRTDLFNPNAIRASLGAIFSVPLVAGEPAAVRAWLQAQQFRIFATRVAAAQIYTQVSLVGRVAIVLGSEAEGLDMLWTGDDVTNISLPMRGVVDSLNVSVTAGVLFYEALRQRTGK